MLVDTEKRAVTGTLPSALDDADKRLPVAVAVASGIIRKADSLDGVKPGGFAKILPALSRSESSLLSNALEMSVPIAPLPSAGGVVLVVGGSGTAATGTVDIDDPILSTLAVSLDEGSLCRSDDVPAGLTKVSAQSRSSPNSFYGRHHQQDSPDNNLVPEWVTFQEDTRPPGGSTAGATGGTSSLFHHPSFDASMADSMMIQMLHVEIGQFVHYVDAITAVKSVQQQKMLHKIQSIVERIWPTGRVHAYGSFATGLSIPSSDLDLVVTGFRSNHSYNDKVHWSDLPTYPSPLQTLAAALKKQSWLRRIQCIDTASMPVIKIVSEVAGALQHVDISFDYSGSADPSSAPAAAPSAPPTITFEQDLSATHNRILSQSSSATPGLRTSTGATVGAPSRLSQQYPAGLSPIASSHLGAHHLSVGPEVDSSGVHRGRQAVELVCCYIKMYPALRPLTIVLKQFLAERALNNTFSGGLSSYCLVLILVSFFQNHVTPESASNLGLLLINLLTFFGTQFDFHRMGISLRSPTSTGGFFYLQVPCPTLVILDPFNPKNNIGKNVFAMYRIKAAFHYALSRLLAPYPPRFAPTLLSRIIHGPPRIRAAPRHRRAQSPPRSGPALETIQISI